MHKIFEDALWKCWSINQHFNILRSFNVTTLGFADGVNLDNLDNTLDNCTVNAVACKDTCDRQSDHLHPS